MYPKWAYGFMQSNYHYKSERQILQVVAAYRKRQLPLDVIIQDWRYWGKGGWRLPKVSEAVESGYWNSLAFNKKRYPAPKRMIDTLHSKYHCHLVVSIWPQFGNKTKVYKAMKSHGYLYPVGGWGEANFTYDAFNPGARKLYWKWIDKGLFSKGVDGWWMDSTEPGGQGTRNETVRFILSTNHNYLGTAARYLNAYSLMDTYGIYKHQRKTSSQKRVFILTRSAFAGQQRNAAATWSGDVAASWNALKRQITAGLNISLAGIPYWTTDIGGFTVSGSRFPGKLKNKVYRELFVRWFEYGAFCPLFRLHGYTANKEIWAFGKPGSGSYKALAKNDKLRYRLLPYIYSQAWQVTHNNAAIMRGLVYDFQQDPKVYDIGDEFMFGPAFLVNPVTNPGISFRNVYLPKGADWISFWSGEAFKGGQAVRAPTPIDHIPLFVRAGSIVPMGPVLQYTSQKAENPMEIRIYQGANGHFTLYEDEGDNYDYEKGTYFTIRFDWNDASKTLTIGKRKGSFPGMIKKRAFHIVLVTKNHGAGLVPAANPDKAVAYDGHKLTVKF
jgi:alpha-D-xyloside xylohydrolase